MKTNLPSWYEKVMCLLFALMIITPSEGQQGYTKSMKAQPAGFSNVKTVAPFTLLENKFTHTELSRGTLLELDKSLLKQDLKSEGLKKIELPLPTSETIEIMLEEADFFTEDFQLNYSSGKDRPIDDAQFYWGVVKNHPNSTVSFTITGDEIMSVIAIDDQVYNLGRLKNRSAYVIYERNDHADPPQVECFSDDLKQFDSEEIHLRASQDASNCVSMYIEVDNDVYTSKGASTANFISGLFSQVSQLYMNEQINLQLGELFIWDTVDPYTGPNLVDYLSQFRNNLGGDHSGDLAHLIGNESTSGLAYINTLCNRTYGVGYSGIGSYYSEVPTYSWSVEVLTHEIGHNLGSPHTHTCLWNGNNTPLDDCGNVYNINRGNEPNSCYDPQNENLPDKGTIMSYCHLLFGVGIDFNEGFGQQPGDLIRNQVYNATCLVACENHCSQGAPCNDEDSCTVNDSYDEDCNCQGTYQDSDNDGVCDTDDVCPGGNDNADYDNDGIPDACDDCNVGIACDDGNACTVNDQYGQDCNCSGTFQDSDNDGVCDEDDLCPGGNDNSDYDNDGIPDACDDCTAGITCDDGNPCTINDQYDQDCNCSGTFQDSDNDGVCDANDLCPGGNDNIDDDNDGIPDACDDCTAGISCDDGNTCTINDQYDQDCNCSGTFQDSDNDGICDEEDLCPGGNDNADYDNDGIPDACDDCTAGIPCDDGIACTTDDQYDQNCNCSGTFQDSDNDGVCDEEDVCSSGNDNLDSDDDGIPDACDDCEGSEVGFSRPRLAHIGSGNSSTRLLLEAVSSETTFSISGMDAKLDGTADERYIDKVQVFYKDISGIMQLHDSYDGNGKTIVMVNITHPISEILVTLSDGLDGYSSGMMNIVLSKVNLCIEENICPDSDGDSVCDIDDICPDGDDNLDNNENGIPDDCESDCLTKLTDFGLNSLEHSGPGSSTVMSILEDGAEEIAFSIYGFESNWIGPLASRYDEQLVVSYMDGTGFIRTQGTYTGSNLISANVNIPGEVKRVYLSLSDGYDGDAQMRMSVDLSMITYCARVELGEITNNEPVGDMTAYPNPFMD